VINFGFAGDASEWMQAVAQSAAVTTALALLLWCILRPPLMRRLLIAPVRHALWWLICVRFLLGLLPIPFVPITLPQAAEGLSKAAPMVRSALTRPMQAYLHRPAHHAPKIAPAQAIVAAAKAPVVALAVPVAPGAASRTISAAPHLSAPQRSRFRLTISLEQLAGIVWCMGLLVLLAATLRDIFHVRRAVHASTPCGSDSFATELLSAVCVRMNCRTPRLMIHPGDGGPMAVGLFWPVIVVPQSCLDTLDESRLRAVLAHEVAHIRRGDLWLSLAPALCRIVLWFMPPVWLAVRECMAGAEEACDLRARQVAQVSVAIYGETLIGLARSGSQLAGAANLSPAYRSLLPRLTALKNESAGAATRLQRASGFLAVAGLMVLLPAYQLCERAHASAGAAQEVSAPTYTLTDLGATLPDGSAASAINDPGVVVGYSSDARQADLAHAVQWQSATASPISAGRSYKSAKAIAVNSQGDVALTTYNYRDWQHAALVSGGAIVKLGTLPKYRYGVASAVNDQRIVAGYLYRRQRSGQLQARPVLWSAGQRGFQPQELGTLGGSYGEAYGVNAAGTIVGKSDTPNSTTHAFAWQSGHMTDLGAIAGASNSAAYAVNSSGAIVGYSRTPLGLDHAVLWTSPTAAPVDLGTLFAGGISKARAINDHGQAVGVSTRPGGIDAHATLWTIGHAYDLNQLAGIAPGWALRYAVAVNNNGQIVGVGQINGKTHAFLLTPVGHRAVPAARD
jgi:probable HAF family extracellular repeat protein